MKNLLLLFAFLPARFLGVAQTHSSVRYLGIDQGLSNNSVSSIFRSTDGFMWFGTYDGLNRYDGYDVKVYRHRLGDAGSLINNWIGVLAEDSARRLWIGTRNGADVFDPEQEKFRLVNFRPECAEQPQPIEGAISDIKTSASGQVYLATGQQGLLVCSGNAHTATPIPLVDGGQREFHYAASALTFSADAQLYVAVRGKGIYQLDGSGRQLVRLLEQPSNSSCLLTDGQGRLWMGTDDGLMAYHFSSGRLTREYQSRNRVVQLAIDQGLLWIASDGDGVLVRPLSGDNQQVTVHTGSRQSLKSDAVFSVYHDQADRTWVGTLRGGIVVFDNRKTRFQEIVHQPFDRNSLVNDFILSVAEDRSHNLWIGTDGGGLSHYNRSTGNFTNYTYQPGKNSISNNFITTVLNDSNNQVWIGSWGGSIDRYDPKTGQFTAFPCYNPYTKQADKNAWTLFIDQQQSLWAGTCADGALYRFNSGAQRFDVFDSTLKNIVCLYEDRRKQLWGGDYYSLIRIDREGRKHKRYSIGFAVRSVFEDAEGQMWVGTEGNGLLLFDRKKENFTAFTEADGLSNNAVLQILPDDKGQLWLSTFKGISVFDTQTRTFRHVLQSDGLLSNQLSYNGALRLQSGELVVGGIKGLNIFSPEKISRPATVQPLLLTNILINNEPAAKQQQLFTAGGTVRTVTLPYDKAVLSMTFVSPEYATPDKIDYAYYLEGWDKTWNSSGRNRTATYTRLQEGSYLFQVKTATVYKNWNAPQTLLKVVVLPPWYRTWWAYTVYALLFCALIYLFLYYRGRQLKLQYDIAFAKREMEQEKALNEKKLSFFTNVSHEFRSPLTLIINPVKELLQRFEKQPEEKELNTVYRNAKRLLSLADQLLLFRKADTEEDQLKVQQLDLYRLCNEVFDCFHQQARAKNIDYAFHSNSPSVAFYGDYEKLEIILFNLVSNAMKFTHGGGSVTLRLVQSAKDIRVMVEDTGTGIAAADADKVFHRFYQTKSTAESGFGIGLYLARKFAEAHEGTLDFVSEPGKGTRFTLLLQPGALSNRQQVSQLVNRRPAILEELAEPLPAPAVAPVPEKALTVAEIVSDRKTILVVDDNQAVREYLREILSPLYQVQEAPDGETAFRLMLADAPDLVISDYLMGELNGIDLCRRIRAHADLGPTPVILLTSSSSDEVKLDSIQGGADDYINKPFDKSFLLARIENLFRSRNAMQQYFLDTVTLKKSATKVSPEYKQFLERCMAIVDEHIDEDEFSTRLLAQKIGMSHSGLYKKIKLVSGQSPNAFIRFIRLRKAAVLLLTTNTNINEAAFQVGINDVKYFREQFKKLFGMTPSEYIKMYKHSFEADGRRG